MDLGLDDSDRDPKEHTKVYLLLDLVQFDKLIQTPPAPFLLSLHLLDFHNP